MRKVYLTGFHASIVRALLFASFSNPPGFAWFDSPVTAMLEGNYEESCAFLEVP
jgi:hypothetical protein